MFTIRPQVVGFGFVQFWAQVAQQILPDPDAQDALEFRVAGKPGVQRRGEPGGVVRALLVGVPLFVYRAASGGPQGYALGAAPLR